MTLDHLERLLYSEGKVAAPLLLPPVVGHVGIADDIWLSEAGVEMEGYSVIVLTKEIDLKPWGQRKKDPYNEPIILANTEPETASCAKMRHLCLSDSPSLSYKWILTWNGGRKSRLTQIIF